MKATNGKGCARILGTENSLAASVIHFESALDFPEWRIFSSMI
jgi:hypothetical protein